jgi:hypothetical protein
MSTHVLLLLALAGPDSTASSAPPIEFAVVPWRGDELHAETLEVVTRARGMETFRGERDVPDLLRLRAAVLASSELGRSERIQLRNRIDYCLEQSLSRLRTRQARLTKETRPAKAAERTLTAPPESSNTDSSLAGGAAQVQQLITLIEATIQPESWANNGGLGTIRYWSPGYALVIRNTQAVHAEIGGLVETLEAQSR